MLSQNCFQNDSSHFQTLHKQNFKSITAPLCCGNCVFFSISKTSWCGLPWWRSHQLSCNFSTRQRCALTRCPLHTSGCFDLTFWPLPRACLPGRVFKFTFFTGCWFQNFWCSLMLRGSTGPSRDDFCLIVWLLSAKITFALIAGASVWRG